MLGRGEFTTDVAALQGIKKLEGLKWSILVSNISVFVTFAEA
jgi:hypothetical protein